MLFGITAALPQHSFADGQGPPCVSRICRGRQSCFGVVWPQHSENEPCRRHTLDILPSGFAENGQWGSVKSRAWHPHRHVRRILGHVYNICTRIPDSLFKTSRFCTTNAFTLVKHPRQNIGKEACLCCKSDVSDTHATL